MALPAFLRSRRSYGIGAAFLVVLVLAGGIYARLAAGADDAEPETPDIDVSATGTFQTGVAIPVEGREAVRDTLVLAVAASGQAEASRRTTVLAQVEGQLLRLPVREGSAVGRGQLLAGIDPSDYRLAVEEAEADLLEARAQYEEMVLFDDRIEDAETRAERQRIARARSGMDRAQVALSRAERDLARTGVRAPFAGRVASVEVVQGQYVGQGEELMTIVEMDPIRLEVQVLEAEVGHLSEGRSASVRFAAFPDAPVRGRIASINPVVERGTRTARVTVFVPNPDGRILPGMYARVALDAREFPDRVLVPRAAILERDRREMLFVYDGDEAEGRAKWRYVTTGLANDTLVEILEDAETEAVRPGETVLTGGHYTLIHDARVRLVDDAEAAGGRP